MRTLACLAAVILAGVPAAAAPILINGISTTELLPAEQLLPETAVEPDGIGSEPSILAPAGTFVLTLHETSSGVLDAHVADAMGPGGWDAYRSNVTSDLLRTGDDDFAASRYAIAPADGSGDRFAEPVTPLGGTAALSDAAEARQGTAGARGALEAVPGHDRRDVVQAAMSRVEPAALTLLGVCLFLLAAGGREWHRRNWHRRHMRRRR